MATKRFLVPVDGSEYAMRALRYAIGRARESQAEIHVLHVEPPPLYQEARLYAMREDIARIHQEAHQRLLQDAVAELQQAGVPHASHLAEGEVANAIAQFADSQRMDEIIMGTRGMTAFGQMLMGSVASRVVHFVKIPVTLLK
ncbi:MAG: universal stress protein [Betaproteobacteria bacterium]|nr:MAG: universal stress protein [Betaproteobacteria bacterium]TAN54375.1 MAG: universal stress protein [Betaproteobacteria bacterium]